MHCLSRSNFKKESWYNLFFFKKRFYLFLERGREGEREREREKHQSVASGTHPNQEPNPNLGMCPDRE